MNLVIFPTIVRSGDWPAWIGTRFFKKIFCLGDDDDDDGYDGEDDGANDVMIGDQNDDYYRHNSSNRHEASLVV